MDASYNGWVASRDPSEIGIVPFVVNGVPFPSGVKGGDVETVFRHLVEQLIQRVEPLLHPGCWGYYFKPSANSAALLSCHSSGTAIDTSAPRHPNGKRGTFTAAQVVEIREILAELEGVIYWGGDAWGDGTPDEMHWEIATGATEEDVARVAAKIQNKDQPLEEDDMPQIISHVARPGEELVIPLAPVQGGAIGWGPAWVTLLTDCFTDAPADVPVRFGIRGTGGYRPGIGGSFDTKLTPNKPIGQQLKPGDNGLVVTASGDYPVGIVVEYGRA